VKQVLQHLRTGQIEVAEVPAPQVRPGHLLIQTTCSLISAGTERMLVEFGRASLIAKARSQPEKVRQVLEMIRADGLLATLEAVFSRLDEPLPLGYCNVGRVIEVGQGVTGFSAGDRVVSNGPHAEIVCVPATLAARIPDDVSDEDAAFTVLGAIALHGIRLLEPTLGESFVVMGVGLIGLIAVQLLAAHGGRVLGMDLHAGRCELARKLGCQSFLIEPGSDPVGAALAFSGGAGVDGVLITAATQSDEPMRQAARMCRKRGRIVSTGNVGMNLERGVLYEKELRVQVSCSYGPGRYDPAYEEQGHDYPLPYVRWTVARNLTAVLNALSTRRLDVGPLISRRLPQTQAPAAYEAVLKDPDVLGVILTYPAQPEPEQHLVTVHPVPVTAARPARPVVGVIGAGIFTKLHMLPAIRKAGAVIKTIASATGVTALHAARKFGAAQATSDYRQILEDPEITTVFITTRHNTHPRLAAEALQAGKHVFVEKPLAIDEAGLELIRQAHLAHPTLHLMVGFNRRFAPHTVAVKKLLQNRSQPLTLQMMVNAGSLPLNHWARDPAVGGGRIIGEGCHFVDLLMYLVGYPITSVQAITVGGDPELAEDKMTIIMTYGDGSIGTVHYWANGPKSYPKERVEIFSEGRVVIIHNFRRLEAYNWKGVPTMRRRQDKGYNSEVESFLERVATGGPPLIPFEELELVTRATFAAVRSAREQVMIRFGTG